MNARFEPSALPTLESERLTRVETIQGQSTDTDFRLPDEPNLPPGYTLKVGGAGWYEHVKTGMDMLATGIVLLVSLPVVLISAALVRITSRGPAFYTQMGWGVVASLTSSISFARCTMIANGSLASAGAAKVTIE